ARASGRRAPPPVNVLTPVAELAGRPRPTVNGSRCSKSKHALCFSHMGRARPTHVPDPKALGTRLRALREARGLSLRQIAFPGCSPSYLSRVESGDRVASLTILAELARRLGTSIEELLGRSIDGRISEGDLAAAEVAARMGAPTADADI